MLFRSLVSVHDYDPSLPSTNQPGLPLHNTARSTCLEYEKSGRRSSRPRCATYANLSTSTPTLQWSLSHLTHFPSGGSNSYPARIPNSPVSLRAQLASLRRLRTTTTRRCAVTSTYSRSYRSTSHWPTRMETIRRMCRHGSLISTSV